MKIRIILLFLLLYRQISFSQIGDTTNFDLDTKRKIIMVCDSLKGKWILISKLTINKDNTDTITQFFSDTSTYQKKTNHPEILITFKKNGVLLITEYHLKKQIITKAKWKIEVKPFDEIDLFYIDIYNSENEKVSNEFKGFITEFENNNFQLTDISWMVTDNNCNLLNLKRRL